jgi:bifunctional UDP-N-acetylglucosamine pyrophosphorylase/glucosamine-1-phosphate N-acetyltransferase
MKVGAIILAAGSGTRLNGGQPSEKPKVLYEICGRPMVSYTVDLLKSLEINEIVMVIGYKAEMVEELFKGQVKFARQEERKGTAHAAKIGEQEMDSEISHLLIIQGDDSAFYKKETINKFIQEAKEYKIGFTTVKLENPGSFGRIVRNAGGQVTAIVEKEIATVEQMKIKEANAATYFVDRGWFNEKYKDLKPSQVGKGEMIMPDLIAAAFSEGREVLGFEVSPSEWVGVNTSEELKFANGKMQERLNGKL